MAYMDYGAFVYLNDKRRTDKEDVGVFDTDEGSLPSGLRIFANLIKLKGREGDYKWCEHSHHGVMGDRKVRVCCHKQGTPTIYGFRGRDPEPLEINSDELEKRKLIKDYFDYKDTKFFEVKEFKKYKFRFIDSETSRSGHYEAYMIEPNGDEWKCVYDYGYGAGHTDVGEE